MQTPGLSWVLSAHAVHVVYLVSNELVYVDCNIMQHRPPRHALSSLQSPELLQASPAMAVPSADAREARHEATTTAAASTTIFLILSEHVWQRPYGAGFGLSWTLIWSG